MKLYISYYDNYIVIVEGMYNYKKDKFNIKNSTFLSIEEIKVENKDKYSLLREALSLNKSKTKNVVFLLNTRDVIVKNHHIPKVAPKDLDGIMNNEMFEMMSLDEEQYTFSYEVTNEWILDDKETLDVITAAISNDELEIILDIFKSNKLNVERIDTISTAYARLISEIEYDDIMMLNVGSYGSILNIYKENSLFIHDNIPVRINNQANYPVSLALVDEVKGLTNFYSSRNFGKNLDTIVVIGEGNKNLYVKETFEESFSSKIIIGIENLIENLIDDINGDLQLDELSIVCDILGSMLIANKNKGYSYMNLLPLNLRNKFKKQNKLKQALIVAPIALCVLASPYLVFGVMDKVADNKISLAQSRLDEIKEQYKDIENIDSKISEAKEEIGIYDMLASKSTKWGNVLSSIDKNIPYKVDLTNVNVSYDSKYIENKEQEIKETTEENNKQNVNKEDTSESEETPEEKEVPIYEQIPNVISIDGIATTPSRVGQFVYSLNKIDYFKSVELTNSKKDEDNGGYTFNIVLVLREGAVSGE